MYRNIIIGATIFLAASTRGSGQCFGGDSLFNKMNALRDSPNLPLNDKIKSLLNLEGKTRDCAYKHDSVHALLLQRIGELYSLQAQFEKAVQYFEKAIGVISNNAAKGSVNPKHLTKAYYRLSSVYDSLGRPTGKMKALDSCIAIALRLKKIDRYCLWALYTRAEYSFNLGDYHRCIEYANLCEPLATDFARNGTREDSELGYDYAISSLIWRVNAMVLLKDYKAAESLLENRVAESLRYKNGLNLGVLYGTLAEILVVTGDAQKAKAYHDKAYAIEKSSGFAINCKATLNSVGYDIYLKSYNNVERALEYYRKALNYKVEETNDQVLSSLESLSILNRIGNIFVLRGQFDSAFRYMQLAFDQVKPGINETGILNISLDEFIRQKRIGYISSLIIDKAEAFHQKYASTHDVASLVEAIRIYKLADQFLGRIKDEQADLRSKLFWRDDRRHLYERAIEACYTAQDWAGAFYFFERSRAVLLYDALNEQQWSKEDDIARLMKLRKRANQLQEQVNNKVNGSPEFLQLQQQFITNQQQLDQLDNRIKTRNPLYYQGYLQTGTLTLNDVQQNLLQGNAKLVELFEGDSAVYSMIVTSSKIYLQRLDKEDFNRDVDEFISYVSRPDKLNKDFNGFLAVARLLYQKLFHEIPMQSGRIIISPDSRYFPVEALVTDKSGPPGYLVESHAVSYVHSAQLLMISFESKNKSPGNFLGMAPVDFQQTLKQVSLQGSDQSLKEIKSLFRNSKLKLFTDASRSNFLSEFADYEIIQLYTHATDGGIGGDPKIYFADSSLQLSELMNESKPRTRLIVLSACETGKGQWFRGEGVFSFNRGFAALGIPSSVTNLWSIDNRSTYKLTELFYKYLAQGLQTDVALQKAKLEFMKTGPKEYQMPWYWASAILGGKVEAIEMDKPNQWRSWLPRLGLAIVCISGFVIWLKYKRAATKSRPIVNTINVT